MLRSTSSEVTHKRVHVLNAKYDLTMKSNFNHRENRCIGHVIETFFTKLVVLKNA